MNKVSRAIIGAKIAVVAVSLLMALSALANATDLNPPLRGSALWHSTKGGFFADGKYILFAYEGIVVYDATDPDSLIELKRYTENCAGLDFVRMGRMIVGRNSWSFISLLKFNAEWELTQSSRMAKVEGMSALGLCAIDDTHFGASFYTEDSNGVMIVECADIANPAIASTHTLQRGPHVYHLYPREVEFDNGTMVVAVDDSVIVFSVDPVYGITRTATYMHSLFPLNNLFNASDLKLRNDTLFALYQLRVWPQTKSTLEIVALNQPDTPSFVGGKQFGILTEQMAITGDAVFLGDPYGWLKIVSVATPSSIQVLDSIPIAGIVSSVTTAENALVVHTDNGNGGVEENLGPRPDTGFAHEGDVQIYKSDGIQYSLFNKLDFSFATAFVINISDNVIACVNNSRGGDVRILDISDVSHPKQLSSMDTEFEPFGGTVRDGKLFLACGKDETGEVLGGALLIYDIHQLQNPALITVYPLEAAWDVAIRDTLAFVGTRGRLVILDIANPLAPKVINWLGLFTGSADVDVDGAFVGVAGNWEGFYIFDISDPTAPRQLDNSANTGVLGFRISFLKGRSAFAVLAGSACAMFSHDSLQVCPPLSVFGNNVQEMTGAGNFITNGMLTDGWEVFNVSNPSSPRLVQKRDGFLLGGVGSTFVTVIDKLTMSAGYWALEFYDAPLPTATSEDLDTHIKIGSDISLSLRSDSRSQSVSLECRSPRREVGSVKLYNIVGQCVASVFEGEIGNAPTTIDWRPSDRDRALASGVYFFKLQTPSGSVAQKWKLIK